MKKTLFSAVLVCLVAFGAFAQAKSTPAPEVQTKQAATPAGQIDERLQLAISSIEYPVTPGDIYQLSYRESSGIIVERKFQVNGVLVLDMGVFGKIDATGMTFFLLKQKVEELIAKNYTYSVPSFTIVAPGVFRVALRDGASKLFYETAWGLTRLSEIVAKIDAPYSSKRNVERVSRNGRAERFDLTKAAISDRADADPFVRSGDVVIFHGAEKVVEVQGEVRRPGRYELFEGEGIRELIEVFAGGFSSQADTQRIRVNRSSDKGERTEYLSLPKDYDTAAELNDGDIVVVSDRTDRRSLVWFTGAVTFPGQGASTGVSPTLAPAEAAAPATGNGRFSHFIREGVMLSDVLKEIRSSILPSADLESALLSKADEKESRLLDLRPLLSGMDLSSDLVLPSNSILFIPELRSTISVAGAVISPGPATYLPGAPAEYYIGLRGGINPERNRNGDFVVYDQYGKPKTKDLPIKAGDNIFLPEVLLTVAVAGAVQTPGLVPYVPGANAGYYISKSGGIDPARNRVGEFVVNDQYGKTKANNTQIEPGDSIFLPEILSTVSVAGAVQLPGLIPYLPGSDIGYYLSRSGGINPERNSGGALTLFDKNGKQKKNKNDILPGDSIFVKNNHWGYQLERTVAVWFPIISMAITVATFGITVGLIN